MNQKRIQLTLFANGPAAAPIEVVRKKFNPEQYQIIKAHATLCREDELVQLEKVIENLKQLNYDPITIRFGKPLRFSENKGVLIPAVEDIENFQELRRQVLKDVTGEPRLHQPHITLMHPRNSSCTDELFKELEKYNFPSVIEFDTISLIEQEMGKQWNILKEFRLKKS